MILITGATGFVGRALTRELSLRGISYKATSRTSHHDFHHVKVIDGQTNWKDILTGVDSIIHLAARAHVLREDAADPSRAFFSINTEGTQNLARQAQSAGVRRFVFVSSIGVNGSFTTDLPFTEEAIPNPHSIYARSKHLAEIGLQTIAERSNMDAVIIRPPLIYGRDAPGNFALLKRLVGTGMPLPLGSINNRRSFIYVENLVDLLITCVDHPAAKNQTFLVSDGEDISTTDLLRRMAHAMIRPSRLVPFPAGTLKLLARCLAQDEAATRLLASLQIDTSKARQFLDWRAPFSVSEGLRRSLADLATKNS